MVGGISTYNLFYSEDSISNPQASRSASGMYFEFLFRRAHSRRRVDRMYWSGVSLYSLTTCSKEVTVGTTGPIGSGLPQFGFPRRFAMNSLFLCGLEYVRFQRESVQSALQRGREGVNQLLFYEELLQKSIAMDADGAFDAPTQAQVPLQATQAKLNINLGQGWMRSG